MTTSSPSATATGAGGRAGRAAGLQVLALARQAVPPHGHQAAEALQAKHHEIIHMLSSANFCPRGCVNPVLAFTEPLSDDYAP